MNPKVLVFRNSVAPEEPVAARGQADLIARKRAQYAGLHANADIKLQPVGRGGLFQRRSKWDGTAESI